MAQAEKVFRDLLCDGRSQASDAADPTEARVIDELRKQVVRLKTDLEAEKQKTRALQSTHVEELKKINEDHERRLESALESAVRKKDLEKQFELKKMEDALAKQKDQELKALAKDKEDELKKIQRKMSKDCEDQVRQAVDAERKFAKEHIEALASGGLLSERETNLTREVFILGEQTFQLESQAQTLRQENKALAEQIRRLKTDHEVEIQDLLRQTKAEAQRDMAQLKLAERIIFEKEQDLQAIEYHAQMAMQEKEALVEELTVIKGLRSSLGNTSSGDLRGDESLRQLAIPKLPGSAGVLQKRVEELEAMVRKAEDEKMEMKHENANLRKKLVLEKVDESGGSKSVKQLEEKLKQLRKKNAELVSLAKSVDDKYKALKLENEQLQTKATTPADSEQQIKKSLSRQHAKDISEYTKQLHTKDKEIEKLRHKLAKLEVEGPGKVTEGANKVTEGPSLLERNFKAMAMEKLRMEKIMSRLYAQLPDIEQVENITKKDLEAGVLKEQVDRLTEENEQLKRRLEAMSPRPPTVDSVDRPQDSPMSELQQSVSLSEGSQDNGPLLETLECRSEGTGSRGAASGSRGEEPITERGKQEDPARGTGMGSEIDHLQAQIRFHVSEKMRMDARILELANEKAGLDAKIQELSAYKDQCVTLQGQLNELQEEGVAKDRKIRQLEELKEQAMEIAHELEATQERCSRLEAELAGLRGELSLREAQVAQLELSKKTELEERVNELDIHMRKVEQLETTIAAKERYCESLRSTLGELQKMVDVREEAARCTQSHATTQTDSISAVNPSVPVTHASPCIAPSLSPSTDSSRALPSSPGPPDAAMVAVSTTDVADSTAGVRTRPISASSTRGWGGGGSNLSSSSLDANLQLEMKKAGFDVPDPYEAVDCLGESTASLTSNLDRKLGVVNLNDTQESVDSVEGSVSSAPSSLLQLPDKNVGGDGLGKRYSVGEEDEDLFHRVVETVGPVVMEPVVMESADGSAAQRLDVVECEDDTLADHSGDYVQPPPPQTTSLFIARFNYNPSEDSPNPNYDQELAITAGEYLYVVGDMDPDGFYLAKLMNGRTGMVPSNYVERVDSCDSTSDDAEMNEPPLETSLSRRKSLNLDKIPEGEEGEEDESEEAEHKDTICPPHHVELLKQFVEGRGYTIAIKWEVPQNLPQDAQGYNVHVNGDLKMFVRNPLETTVMLSDIPRHTRVKISLQTVASSGLLSEPSQPLILNPQYPEPPTNVQVSKAEGNAAILVSWPAVILDTQVEGDSPVTGYTIYLNGTKCVDLLAGATPTKDKMITCQVLLEPLDTPPSMLRVRPASLVLTVRSVAQYESADSAPVQLSKEMSDMLLGDGGDFLGSRDFTGSHMTNGVHHDNGFTQKYFKALYDYKPVEQSLNDEGVDQELAFSEGDIILAKTDIDEDGFFEGELKGQHGLVPKNLVQEIAQAEVVSVSNGTPHLPVMVVNGSGFVAGHHRGDGDVGGSPCQMVAIYDYDPSKDSLNSDGTEAELAFHAGDVITVFGKVDDGFIQGELHGRKGLVPTTFIEPLQQLGGREALVPTTFIEPLQQLDHKVEVKSLDIPTSAIAPMLTVGNVPVQGDGVEKSEKKQTFLKRLRKKKET